MEKEKVGKGERPELGGHVECPISSSGVAPAAVWVWGSSPVVFALFHTITSLFLLRWMQCEPPPHQPAARQGMKC